MSKHSHISAIFHNAFQSRAGSPDVYMSMIVMMNIKQVLHAKFLVSLHGEYLYH